MRSNRQLLNGCFGRIRWMMQNMSRDSGYWNDETWRIMLLLKDQLSSSLGKRVLDSEFWDTKEK